MPRIVDTVKEAKELTEALQRGESGRRQFVFRIDVGPASLLMKDCVNRNLQPGPRLAEVVTEYYEQWEQGVHLTLPLALRRAVDVIAAHRGKSREEAVTDLLQRIAFVELKEITTAAEERNELLTKAEKLVGVGNR